MWPMFIDKSQSTFMEGMSILQTKWCNNWDQKGKKCVIIKVDYEKMYDLVRWDFLHYMTSILSWSNKWINWTKECFELATISVLVNDSPTNEFKSCMRLRQRDPLVLFCF